MNLIIIPARWGSTRFPGKPLALINNVPMVVRVWRQCKKAEGFDDVIVATDDHRVMECCHENGCATAFICGEDSVNGTERCGALVEYLSGGIGSLSKIKDEDLIINVQGDEPLMEPVIPQRLLFNLKLKPDLVWTAIRGVREGEQESRHVVKCQVRKGFIDYFTRRKTRWGRHVHVGVYGYSVKRLKEYCKRGMGKEEVKLNLEQLRWRESLACINVKYDGVGVDVPSDIYKVEAILNGPETVAD